jgi:propanediol dehydratase small subunit
LLLHRNKPRTIKGDENVSEPIGAKIVIGGDITPENMKTLRQCIETQCDIDDEDETDRGALVLQEFDRNYGRFEELESLCRELGLTYIRYSDATWEWDAEVV